LVDAVRIIEAEGRKHPGDDRPVFVGQAPSRHGDPTKPLTGRPGRKLAELASMVPMEFYLSTVRVNLLPYYVGTNGDGDAFPMPDARGNAERMAPVLDGRTVVLVGRRVAEAFGCRLGWFEWGDDHFAARGGTVRIRYATIPHPSGRNRFWNDQENTQAARRFMTELMKVESSVPQLRMLRERARAIGETQLRRRTAQSMRGDMSGLGTDRVPPHERAVGSRGAR
jgi:uracil-DNA glycosylase